jgi:acetylornithine aminotransferase
MATLDALKSREEAVLCHTYGRYPLAVERAQGCRLHAPDGREFVDLLAGIAVCNLGHCRPELAEAMAEQAHKLVHVSNLFYQEPQLDLAEKLLATCHADKVFFCNSGAEANEAAVKLARRYMQQVRGTDAGEVLTLAGSFHGRTLGMIAATGQEPIKQGFAPIPPGFATVPWHDLAALRAAITERTAAVLVEVVQGEGGVRPMDPDHARAVQQLCRERGVLFMVDEIQTGLGRTGAMWGFQRYGLQPDVFTSAKGLANGLPMGAMLATDEVARAFTPGSHATTFGGGPVLSAVAAKVLDILEQEQLAARAMRVGEEALDMLRGLQMKHPDKVREVRGMGLMLGIDLAFPGQEVWKRLLEQGFVCNLTQNTVLRLLPPLTIPLDDLQAFTQALDGILADL